MIKSFRMLVIAGVFAMLWCLPLHADNHESESIATSVLITPKKGHDAALIKAITDYHHWIANFEGHMKYNWYEILTGPNTGKYVARSGGHQWAEFDAEYDWQKEAGEVFEKNVLPNIESIEQTLSSEMTAMSYWPEDWDGYSLFFVEQWYVHNGKGGQFRKGLKKIVDTLKAGGFPVHFGFHSVVSGGHGNQITFVSPKKGWADMSEKSPGFVEIMSKELGSEEAVDKFMSEWGSTFKTGRKEMAKLMPEASDYGK